MITCKKCMNTISRGVSDSEDLDGEVRDFVL